MGDTSALQSATQFENEVGVQAPLGLWDPLGFLNGIDQVTFDRYRYAEIKHGRVAQLAFIGHLVTALGIRFPGYISSSAELKFEDIPAGLGALSAVPTLGLLQIFLFCGVLEFSIWKPDDEKYDLRAKELNQGRAAMMGILGLMVHEYHF